MFVPPEHILEFITGTLFQLVPDKCVSLGGIIAPDITFVFEMVV